MSKEFSPEEYKTWLSEQPMKMVVVKAIIKSELGNILIAKPTYKNTWQFPGGGVDAEESPEDAVVREVSEELNLSIVKQALKIVGTIHKKDDDTLFLLYEYGETVAESEDFVLPSDELKAYEFVDVSEVAQRLPDHYSDFLNSYISR